MYCILVTNEEVNYKHTQKHTIITMPGKASTQMFYYLINITGCNDVVMYSSVVLFYHKENIP